MRAKFNVGDKVRVLKRHDDNKDIVGQVGEVAAIWISCDYDGERCLYGIKFAKKIAIGHDLYHDGKVHCKHGHGWWLPAFKLEKVSA